MPQYIPDYTSSPIGKSNYWSSDIPEFPFILSKGVTKGDVVITLDGEEILSETLYSANGTFYVNPSRIINEEMKYKRLFRAVVSITFTASLSRSNFTFSVYYSSRRLGVTPDLFVSSNFLTLFTHRSLPLGWSDSVSAYTKKGEFLSYTTTVVYYDSSDILKTTETVIEGGESATFGVTTISVRWPELPEGSKPVSMSIRLNGRIMTWYAISHADVSFCYDNVFGIDEFITSKASVSRKIGIQGSMARISSKLRRYDTEETEEYTITLPPASNWEMQNIEQIASANSPSCAVLMPNNDQPRSYASIVVSSCELTDDDGAERLPVPKLTFRCVDTYPIAHLPSHGGVFSDEFSPQFD